MSTAVVKAQYLSPAVAGDYDQQRFSSLAGQTFDRLEQRAIARLVQRAVGSLPTGCRPRVLDAPCGTGRITRLLLDLGLNVTGGDISPAMIDQAKARCAGRAGTVDFAVMDLDRLDLPDNSFDLVTCIRLFHHLQSPQRRAVLGELARVSRRYVLVNVSYSSPLYRARRRCKRLLGQGVSRASSTRREIAAEAAAAGLRIAARRFVLPAVSEDLILLLEKTPSTATPFRHSAVLDPTP
jgi:ubiquinone/menaquinone biosynthesis C-methylase UbiE